MIPSLLFPLPLHLLLFLSCSPPQLPKSGRLFIPLRLFFSSQRTSPAKASFTLCTNTHAPHTGQHPTPTTDQPPLPSLRTPPHLRPTPDDLRAHSLATQLTDVRPCIVTRAEATPDSAHRSCLFVPAVACSIQHHKQRTSRMKITSKCTLSEQRQPNWRPASAQVQGKLSMRRRR